jgi:hypothetical protein
MKAGRKPTQTESSAKQVASFIAKFDPAVAKLTRSARLFLRKRFPTAIELVYDNYNALAIGFSSTEKTSDVLFSLAVYPRWVNLYFMYGRTLPDPQKLLQGSGNQGSFVRLDDLGTLDKPAVKALMEAAINQAESPLASKGRGYTIIKSVSKKQRPRRLVGS